MRAPQEREPTGPRINDAIRAREVMLIGEDGAKIGVVNRFERFDAPYASMVHDFIVTANYVLFPILPLTGSMDRAMSGRPAYMWEPDKGAYVGIMKRGGYVVVQVDNMRERSFTPLVRDLSTIIAEIFRLENELVVAWEGGPKGFRHTHCLVFRAG